jgi:hypothetical protein
VNDLDALVQKAIQSTLFTAPVLEPDLARFLQAQGEPLKELAQRFVRDGYEHIFWQSNLPGIRSFTFSVADRSTDWRTSLRCPCLWRICESSDGRG